MTTHSHLIQYCARDGVGGWHEIHPTNVVDHEIEGWFETFYFDIDGTIYLEDSEEFRTALGQAKTWSMLQGA